MIYYLTEFTELDDDFTQQRVLRRKEVTIPHDNYLPFLVDHPWPGQEVAEDALIRQFQDFQTLNQSWSDERSRAVSFTQLVRINNKFLKDTKHLMLPFQYGETFRWGWG